MAIFSSNQENGSNGYYINIEGYYDKIHRTTWARRTAGWLGGATLGAIYGAIGGVAAAFVPWALGAIGVAGAAAIPISSVVAAIPASAGLFAAITAGIGLVFNADVSANAASSAVGLEEKERREREYLNGNGHCVGADCPPPEQEPPHKITLSEKEPPFFNWKVAAVTAGLFAAFGALIALNPTTASMLFKESMFESLTTKSAMVAASASVFGIFGAFVGLKNSFFSNKLTNFYYKLVTGHIFEKEPQQDMAMQVQPRITEEKALENGVDEASRPRRSYAADRKRVSLQDLIEKREKPCSPQETVMLR